jgi:hypothetical protein
VVVPLSGVGLESRSSQESSAWGKRREEGSIMKEEAKYQICQEFSEGQEVALMAVVAAPKAVPPEGLEAAKAAAEVARTDAARNDVQEDDRANGLRT